MVPPAAGPKPSPIELLDAETPIPAGGFGMGWAQPCEFALVWNRPEMTRPGGPGGGHGQNPCLVSPSSSPARPRTGPSRKASVTRLRRSRLVQGTAGSAVGQGRAQRDLGEGVMAEVNGPPSRQFLALDDCGALPQLVLRPGQVERAVGLGDAGR